MISGSENVNSESGHSALDHSYDTYNISPNKQ